MVYTELHHLSDAELIRHADMARNAQTSAIEIELATRLEAQSKVIADRDATIADYEAGITILCEFGYSLTQPDKLYGDLRQLKAGR